MRFIPITLSDAACARDAGAAVKVRVAAVRAANRRPAPSH